jgi:hypothetical protein
MLMSIGNSSFIGVCLLLLEMLLNERDMHKVIEAIQHTSDGSFLYLAHAYSRDDTRHSYYNLK